MCETRRYYRLNVTPCAGCRGNSQCGGQLTLQRDIGRAATAAARLRPEGLAEIPARRDCRVLGPQRPTKVVSALPPCIRGISGQSRSRPMSRCSAKLTLNTYTYVVLFDISDALETLPGMMPQAEKQTALALKTGTNDLPVNAVTVPGESNGNVLARRWALLGVKPKNSMEPAGVLAAQSQGEAKPHESRQNRMVVGDFNQCARRESNLQPSASEADALSN